VFFKLVELTLAKARSFKEQMEFFYQGEIARWCAFYKEMEDLHEDK